MYLKLNVAKIKNQQSIKLSIYMQNYNAIQTVVIKYYANLDFVSIAI